MLHASYDMRRVNHSAEYVAADGANVNQAESWFSRLRRAEYGSATPDQRPASSSRMRRNGVARGSPPRAERAAMAADDWGGAAASDVRNMARLLGRARPRKENCGRNACGLCFDRARARLAGNCVRSRQRCGSMKKALASIDLCIRMFKTDYDPEFIARKVTLDKNVAVLPKGRGSCKALDILREIGVPLTALELAWLILERMGKRAERAGGRHAREDHP